MFINDLEFISSCDQEYTKPNFGVRGGSVASYANANTSTTDDAVYASAEAAAVGDYTQANTVTGAVFIDRKFYTAGYGVGYGVAVGANRSGQYVANYASSVSVV